MDIEAIAARIDTLQAEDRMERLAHLIETAATTGRTAADEYRGDSPEVRKFLSAFEI